MVTYIDSFIYQLNLSEYQVKLALPQTSRYDPKTKMSETLLDDLYFANGIALSDNEDYLLVNDLARARVLKYHLKGAKQGKTEVLLKTPGLPDNLVAIGKDRYGKFYKI